MLEYDERRFPQTRIRQYERVAETILPLTSDLLAEATQLYVAVFNGEPWNDGWTPASAGKRLGDMMASPGFVGLGLWEGGDLVGIVIGHTEQYFVRQHYVLQEMCVRSELQRSGRGTRLLNALLERLGHLDVEQIYLITLRDGQAASFYTKNGFRSAVRSNMFLHRFD